MKISHLRSFEKSFWPSSLGSSLVPSLGSSPTIEFLSSGIGSSRDRVDLMIDRRQGGYRVGLFDKFRTGLVDLQGCPQLSPDLEAWLQEFRRIEFPISRGSIRLRVAPDRTRGVWLDFANVDIKTLIDERTTFEALIGTGAIIEIGQRRKRLVEAEGRFRLADPTLFPWFETYVNGKSVPLYTTIGTFTQPGFRVNQLLVQQTLKLAETAGGNGRAAEFGSGIGNFTLPLSARFEHVDAYELDELALKGLARTLSEQERTNVTIHSGNFQGDRALALDFSNTDLLLVDPPRSGLMNFVEPLANAKPRTLLYVSCFTESFAADAERLNKMGYEFETLKIIDQFPQSRHYELIALFRS